MADILPIIGGASLALISAVAFALAMWSIIQTAFRLGIKRGREIERGEWNNVGKLGRCEDG